MRDLAAMPGAFVRTDSTAIVTPALPWGLLAGSTVGPWRVGPELRRDPRGITYQAVHVDDGRRAALVLVHAPALAFGSYVEAAAAAMEAVDGVDHPGIVHCYGAGLVADGRPYIVTERADGVTLARWMRDNEVPYQRAVELVRAIAEVLACAHAAGVVHGSLDAEHVLVTERCTRVRLLDWGVMRAIDDEAQRAGFVVARDTSAVISGDPTPERDVHALGRIAYQLVAPDPAMVDVPPGFAAVVRAMLASEPSDRPTCAEIVHRLERLPEDPPVKRARPREVKYVVPCAPAPSPVRVAAAILGVIAFAALWLTRDDGPHTARAAAAAVTIRAPSVKHQPVETPARHVDPPQIATTANVAEAVAAPPARTRPAPRPPAPKRVAVARPAVGAPSQGAVIMEYQRVGHELDQRNASPELWAQFRAIRITAAVETAASRTATMQTLAALHATATSGAE